MTKLPTLIDIETGGFKHGELMVMMARQTGKSTFFQYAQQWDSIMKAQPKYSVKQGPQDVDGKNWYTISCCKEVSIWFRETFSSLENKEWHEHREPKLSSNVFDMAEELYTIMALKWTGEPSA